MSGQVWFTQKRYGYGVTPSNWKGWAFLVAIVVATVVLAAALLPQHMPLYLIAVALEVGTTFVVCSVKSEGRMRWRWGRGDPGAGG